MGVEKPTPEHKTIKISFATWKILSQMKLDITEGGTFEDLLKVFIEKEGY